ncbi:BCL2 modifying factor 2 [Triplophysa dalaica]|uniref:BCL2 modifying factor 2 n=1 Tax=Triplophysa dalaica TaxID=1582913 RepID=UPI0024DFCD93|nr:BCL2 modifying factor 2 [Triplophysa dalaica]XP_056619797.1 BCL2 modifying factor 2 [Triplophysa dalaica]
MEDDEEEQLPHSRETPLTNQSTENRDASRGQTPTRQGRFENRSTQTLNSARAGEMAPLQGSERGTASHCGDAEARTAFRGLCGFASFATAPGVLEGPRALFHGNAGFRAHFPALFEPVPDANSEESEVEERRTEDKDDEDEAGTSVEVQIGRKLREMGDHFQREHLQLFTQHQRDQMGWFQLVTSLYNFLFPQEGPQNVGAQR